MTSVMPSTVPADIERSGASAAVDGLRQLLGDQERISQVTREQQCRPFISSSRVHVIAQSAADIRHAGSTDMFLSTWHTSVCVESWSSSYCFHFWVLFAHSAQADTACLCR